VLSSPEYRQNVTKLRDELAGYDPFSIIERCVVGESAIAAQ